MVLTGYIKVGNDYRAVTITIEQGVIQYYGYAKKDAKTKEIKSDFDIVSSNWASPFIRVKIGEDKFVEMRISHLLKPRMNGNHNFLISLNIWQFHWLLIRTGKHEIFEQHRLIDLITWLIAVVALIVSIIGLFT